MNGSDGAVGSGKLDDQAAFELTPYLEARHVLAELEALDLSPSQREALGDLQAAMRQIDETRHLAYHWPMIVLTVGRGPAELKASPSDEAPILAVLEVGTSVVTFWPFSHWAEIEVIDFPVDHRELRREPGPPVGWHGAGYVDRDLLDYDPAAQSRFDREVLASALSGYQMSFSSPGSDGCLDDLRVCRQRPSRFDCELIMIVCIGEAYIEGLG